MARAGQAPKRPGPFKRWLDRVVLRMLMGIAIAVAERRLRKVLDGVDDGKKSERIVEIK